MGSINLSSEEKDSFSRISNNFIDYYMSDANGEFVKVYLYLLRLYAGNKPVSISGIADHLACTEADVSRALKYWIAKDVLKTVQGADGNVGLVISKLTPPKLSVDAELALLQTERSELDSIDLISEGTSDAASDYYSSTDTSKDSRTSRSASSGSETRAASSSRKKSLPAIMARTEDPNFHELTILAEAYFNRILTQADLELLVHVYDELGFSFELCEYLLEYCAGACGNKQPVKVSYVKTVAQTWHDNHLSTKEEAQFFTTRFFSLYGNVMRELGIRERGIPAPVEKQMIDRWAKDFKFDDTIIIEACRRAVLGNHASMSYVNGILERWYAAKVTKVSDIFALDKKFEEELARAGEKKKARKKPSISDIKQTDMSDELSLIEKLSMRPNQQGDSD